MWGFYLLVPAAIAYILTRRIILETLDRRRIRTFIEARGLTLVDLNLALFVTGWGDNSRGRTYTVRLRDRSGKEGEISCRTSLLGGVYFTDELEGPVRLNLPTPKFRSSSTRTPRRE